MARNPRLKETLSKRAAARRIGVDPSTIIAAIRRGELDVVTDAEPAERLIAKQVDEWAQKERPTGPKPKK